MMNYYYPYHMSYGYSFGGFFSFLWFFLVLWLLFKVFKHFFGNQPINSSSDNTTNTPLDILKTRYAKGEITKKEFDQIKKDLS